MTDGAVPDGRDDAPRVRAEFIVLAVIFVTLGALRINDLFLYTPDSARYLIWGHSIAHGEGYADGTQPVPLRYVAHAPLYPALIAPVEFFFPLRVVPVKITTLAWGVTALLLLYLWLYHLFGRYPALGGASLLALNPGFLVFSTEVLSEAPFTAVLLLILFIMARSERRGAFAAAEWWTLLAASSLIGLLREVGIVVTAAIALALWARERKKAVAVALCGAAFVAAWYIRNSVVVGVPSGAPGANIALVMQRFLATPDESIVTEFLLRIWTNAASYAPRLGGLSFFPLYGPQHMLLLDEPSEIGSATAWVAIIVIGGTMLYGIVRSVGSGKGGRLPFIVGMLLFLAALLYPVGDTRFLAPLLPLMIVFLTAGVIAASKRLGGGDATTVAAALLILLPNIPALAGLVSLNFRYNDSPQALHAEFAGRETYPYYYTQPWGLLRPWLDAHIPPEAVLATPAKELALIAGGRKVLELDPGVPQSVFDRLLRTNGVSYLLAPTRWGDVPVYESLMAASRRCDFTEIHAIGNLQLYQVRYLPFDRDRPTEAVHPHDGVERQDRQQAAGFPNYGSPASGAARLFRAGWERIRNGDYDSASTLLVSAAGIAPGRPEIRHAALVAASLRGDSTAASGAFRQLLGIQQAASYIFSAKKYLELSVEASGVSRLPDGEERAMRLLGLCRGYWDLGLYDHATRLLGGGMSADSSFFVGHLWNFHFHFQTGDTATARTALGTLSRIDSTNSLVQHFHTLMDLRKAVRLSPSPTERSALRLRMARIDLAIELFDESWDQALAAAADDPASASVTLFLADLYAREGNPAGALTVCRAFLASQHGDPAVRAMADSLQGADLR